MEFIKTKTGNALVRDFAQLCYVTCHNSLWQSNT